jgi:hypothetical protein
VWAIELIRSRFNSPKLFVLILMITVLAGSYFSYSMTNSIVITSTGVVSMPSTITAKSGSPSDIQAAINSINSNSASNYEGTVIIPAGNWTWQDKTVNVPAGINIMGTGLAGNDGHTDNWTDYSVSSSTNTIIFQNETGTDTGYHDVIDVYGLNGNGVITVHNQYAPTRISGIYFQERPPSAELYEEELAIEGPVTGGDCIDIADIYSFRIDHCTFVNFCSCAVYVTCGSSDVIYSSSNTTATTYGCIDHCTLYAPYKLNNPAPYYSGYDGWNWACGVYTSGSLTYAANGFTFPFTIASFYGQFQAVLGGAITYFEDNHATYNNEVCDGWQGGFDCVRYDLFTDCSASWGSQNVEDHGPRQTAQFGYNVPSAMGLEVYNCTFANWPYSQCTETSGGARPIGYSWIDATEVGDIDLNGGHLISYNNTFYVNEVDGSEVCNHLRLDRDDPSYHQPQEDCNQTYIWSNTYINTGGSAGFSQVSANSPLAQNTNYFLRAPTQAQDGFTYTPYTYPVATS